MGSGLCGALIFARRPFFRAVPDPAGQKTLEIRMGYTYRTHDTPTRGNWSLVTYFGC
jgi:hypothetical protein